MTGYYVDFTDADDTAAAFLTNGAYYNLAVDDTLVVVSFGSVLEMGAGSTAVYLDGTASGVNIIVEGLIYGDNYAIRSLGSSTSIQVNGSVIAHDTAIGLDDGGGIHVGSNGSVSATDTAIKLGTGRLVNDGTISSTSSHVIEVDGGSIVNDGVISSDTFFSILYDGDESSDITNNGLIVGDIVGAGGADDTTVGLDVDNHGTLSGRIQMFSGQDFITNTGRITGSVSLGDGGDTVISTYGYIGSEIDTGDGADIVLAGAEDNQVTGGAGGDNLDGGGGINTLAYLQSARGVRVNLLTGTASHGDAGGDIIKHFSNVLGSIAGRDVLTGDNGDNLLSGYIGRDKVYGGGGNDTLAHLGTGTESLYGGDGNDLIAMQSLARATYGEALTAKTTVDGGNGFDTLELVDIVPVVFGANTVTGIERIVLLDGFSYSLTTHNATVVNSGALDVEASSLTAGHKVFFDGSAETGGKFTFEGGADADTFIGGGGADTIEGGVGADKLSGGAGADTFSYYDVTDSTFAHHDKVTDFLAGTDKFQMDVEVTGIDAAVTGATVSNGTQLHNAVAGHLNANHAIVVQVTVGSEAGHILLVVDGNGVPGYQTAADYVIDVTGGSGALTTADFIVG